MYLYANANYIINYLKENCTEVDVTKSDILIESNNDCDEEIEKDCFLLVLKTCVQPVAMSNAPKIFWLWF